MTDIAPAASLLDAPELPGPGVAVRGPDGSRWKPARWRWRDGRLEVFALAADRRSVARVAWTPVVVEVTEPARMGRPWRLVDVDGGEWQVSGAPLGGCGCLRVIRGFDPETWEG